MQTSLWKDLQSKLMQEKKDEREQFSPSEHGGSSYEAAFTPATAQQPSLATFYGFSKYGPAQAERRVGAWPVVQAVMIQSVMMLLYRLLHSFLQCSVTQLGASPPPGRCADRHPPVGLHVCSHLSCNNGSCT